MNMQHLPEFSVIGISVRTTNEATQAATDIPSLWQRFMAENISAAIPNKMDDAIYSIYTEYEKDHTKPYTTILGCHVSSLDAIPDGMIGKTFKAADYVRFVAKGNLNEGVVYNEWTKIWNSDLERAFTADFEIYGEKAQNPESAEVEIFIATRC